MVCLSRRGANGAARLCPSLVVNSPQPLKKPDLDHPRVVAAFIDHTLLKPEATRDDIGRLCAEAREFGFATVCVNPYWVKLAATTLDGSPVRIATVAGFPLGANKTPTKILEAEQALRDGATEIDMVLNIGALRSGDREYVRNEIARVGLVAHAQSALLKIILETCLLTDEQKNVASRLAAEAGADFVKTSTGFAKSGATQSDIRLMREAVGPKLGVKASGGIRTLAELRAMIAAGANRIGTSSGVSILRELEPELQTAASATRSDIAH